MSNSYYNHGGWPSSGGSGASSTARAEFDNIVAGFAKLPPLTGGGVANQVVVIDPTGSFLTSVAAGSIPSGGLTIGSTAMTLGNTYTTIAGLTLTGATLTGATLTTATVTGTLTSSNVTITGGTIANTTIDNTVVGGTAPNAGTFTALTVNGALTLSNTAIQNIVSALFPNPATDLENLLINGDMRVSQINGSSSVAVAASSGTYTIDQWVTGTGTTQALSVTRAGASGQSAGGAQYSLSFSVTTAKAGQAAGDTTLLAQYVEGLNSQKLNWGTGNARTVTLQFRFATSIANAVLPIAIVNGANNRSYVTSITTGTANTWATYNVTVPGDTSGTWAIDNTAGMRVYFGFGIGSTFQATPNTWTAGQFLTVSGATNFMSSLSNTWQITDVDLKAGSLVLPITRRSYEAELLLCQRYLPCVQAVATNEFLCMGTGQTATSSLFQFSFKVPTRVPVTGITLIGAVSNFTAHDGSTSTVLTGLTFNSGQLDSTLLVGATAAGLTAFRPYFLLLQAGAGFYLTGAQL